MHVRAFKLNDLKKILIFGADNFMQTLPVTRSELLPGRPPSTLFGGEIAFP